MCKKAFVSLTSSNLWFVVKIFYGLHKFLRMLAWLQLRSANGVSREP
jgi:hypothetical protein